MLSFWLLALGMTVVAGGILFLRLHPFLALLMGGLLVAALTPGSTLLEYATQSGMGPDQARKFASSSVGERLVGGFGNTCAKVGLLIALASVIGRCLLDSGAAERIVRAALRGAGERAAPVAFLGSGFLLAVPVFFDAVFFLLVPLAKSLGLRPGGRYGLYVLSSIAGATMAHSLVPPTPGPLFVAKELGLDLGTMILGGFVVGLVASSFGFLYALWATKRWPLPVRDSPEMPLANLQDWAKRDPKGLPSLSLSLVPVVLPVLLIAGHTWAGTGEATGGRALLRALGDPNIALAVGAAAAMLLLIAQRWTTPQLADAVQSALAGAGVIILITGAGGAFGGVLQHTGVAGHIEQLASSSQLALLPLAFGVTALVRTAQGSATVAMVTAVGMLAGLAEPGRLDFHPLYLALAIGCGSKPFPWMNDSGFWVIARMSGMTVPETLRSFSVMLTGMGLVGLVLTMFLAWVFPMSS